MMTTGNNSSANADSDNKKQTMLENIKYTKTHVNDNIFQFAITYMGAEICHLTAKEHNEISENSWLYDAHKGKRAVYISEFKTQKPFRKKGLATKLLTFVKQHYGDSNTLLYLQASPVDKNYMTLEDLVKFYKSMGFIHEAPKNCYTLGYPMTMEI